MTEYIRPNILLAGSHALPVYSKSACSKIKIAIIQTGSWGDNINSTIMLRPIIDHYNGDCTIDVHTSTYYASAFYNNNLIDNIIKHVATNKQSALHLTLTIPDIIKNNGYDKIFAPHPMFNHSCWCSSRNPTLGENLIYAWVHALERENIEIEMPPTSILRLKKDEIDKVDVFCKSVAQFSSKRKNIMEVHGESGQSFWNDKWTMAVVDKLCSRNEIVFISSRRPYTELQNKYSNLCYCVDKLSIRECAELFNRCDKFFSISSGLSNACNTDWCKKDIEWVEVINSMVVSSSPIRKDNKTFWMENDLDKFITTL